MRGRIVFLSAAVAAAAIIAALLLRQSAPVEQVEIEEEAGGWSIYRSEDHDFGFRYPPGSSLAEAQPDPRAIFGVAVVFQGHPQAAAEFLITAPGAFEQQFKNLLRSCPGLPSARQDIGDRSVRLMDASDCPGNPPRLYALIEMDSTRDLVYQVNLDPWITEEDLAYGILQTLDIFTP